MKEKILACLKPIDIPFWIIALQFIILTIVQATNDYPVAGGIYTLIGTIIGSIGSVTGLVFLYWKRIRDYNDSLKLVVLDYHYGHSIPCRVTEDLISIARKPLMRAISYVHEFWLKTYGIKLEDTSTWIYGAIIDIQTADYLVVAGRKVNEYIFVETNKVGVAVPSKLSEEEKSTRIWSLVVHALSHRILYKYSLTENGKWLAVSPDQMEERHHEIFRDTGLGA